MGFRNYDWQCSDCGAVRECLVWVDHGERPPKMTTIECLDCGDAEHARIVSLIAEYHGERQLSPVVHGGKFDTAGYRAMPTMDPLPQLGPDASRNERKEQVDAYKERFASKEWQDLKARRADVRAENQAKRKRLNAMKRGENVNMRRDKLPGDPKVSA